MIQIFTILHIRQIQRLKSRIVDLHQFACDNDFQLFDENNVILSGNKKIFKEYLISGKQVICAEMAWSNQTLTQFAEF